MNLATSASVVSDARRSSRMRWRNFVLSTEIQLIFGIGVYTPQTSRSNSLAAVVYSGDPCGEDFKRSSKSEICLCNETGAGAGAEAGAAITEVSILLSSSLLLVLLGKRVFAMVKPSK